MSARSLALPPSLAVLISRSEWGSHSTHPLHNPNLLLIVAATWYKLLPKHMDFSTSTIHSLLSLSLSLSLFSPLPRRVSSQKTPPASVPRRRRRRRRRRRLSPAHSTRTHTRARARVHTHSVATRCRCLRVFYERPPVAAAFCLFMYMRYCSRRRSSTCSQSRSTRIVHLVHLVHWSIYWSIHWSIPPFIRPFIHSKSFIRSSYI